MAIAVAMVQTANITSFHETGASPAEHSCDMCFKLVDASVFSIFEYVF
jgi:hypothetical protein